MVNERLKVDLCGIGIDNPIIPASGTFGYGYEFAELYDINMLGTFSFKGTTWEARFGNPTPRIAECEAGMINAVGLQNPGVDAVIAEELPRLASALLGCSYDELQRRRRQYRIRRAVAIVAAAFLAVAGIAGYSLYMTKKINDSYMEVLRSRSISLASTSRDLLKEDLRVESVHLALEALPKDDKDKTPVTAEAVRALTDATAAYVSNSGNNFAPVWNYKTEYEIKKGDITDDNRFVGVIDRTGTVYCWSTQSHELIFEKTAESEVRDFLFLGNDTVMIVFATHVEAYNIQTGSFMWEFYTKSDTHNYNPGDVIFADNSVYIDDGDGKILKLAMMDGKELASYALKTDMDLFKTYECLAVSSDGKKIAYADSDFVFVSGKIFIYD